MTITLNQLSFNGGEWSRSLYARTDLPKYNTAVRTMKNFICHPNGGASNRGGTQYVGEVKDSSKFTRIIPFQFSVEQSYILEFGNQYMRIIKDGGIVVDGSGSAIEVTTPWLTADLPLLKYTQSADVLYITHPTYQPRKISRTSDTSWTISAITFGATVSAPTNLTGTGTTSDPTYKVTAVDSAGRESVGSVNTQNADGNGLSWSASASAVYYNIYKDRSNSGVFGFVGKASNTTFNIPSGGIDADFSKSIPEATTLFNTTDNYPGVCTFFEQRLVFARTNDEPQTIWGSVVGDFESMNISAFLSDGDAYAFTINSRQVNEIKGLVPLEQMVILTAGAEWIMSAGGTSDAVTPTSVNIKRQSSYGSSDVQPIVIGNSVLFIEGGGRIVRDLTYSFEVEGYRGNSLSIFANHLTDGYEITDWSYQRDPDSIIWAIRDDGALLGLTYLKEFNVFGWHQHDTSGSFESVATISTAEDLDETYFVVKRTINSSTVRYIERFKPRLPFDSDYNRDIKQAWFVDCGLNYDGTASTSISGLDHLEGASVAILADGNVVKGKTVNSGAVTLPNAAEKVQVGLPYTSDIETLDFVGQTNEGIISDKLRDVKEIVVSLKDTRGMWYGPSSDRLREVKFRTTEDYGNPTSLYNGDKELILDSGEIRESRVYIQNVDPVPITVLSILPRLDVGEQ